MGHFQEHSPGRSRHVHGPLSRTFTREVTSRLWTTLENIHQGGHVTSMDHFREHSPGRSRHVYGPLSRTFTREVTSLHGPLSRTFTREVTSRPWIILKNIHQGGHVAFTDHFQEHSPGRSRHVPGPLSRTFTREAISCTESRNRKRDWAQYRPGVILNRMEERSGVNGRQLFVRVDRNLEE